MAGHRCTCPDGRGSWQTLSTPAQAPSTTGSLDMQSKGREKATLPGLLAPLTDVSCLIATPPYSAGQVMQRDAPFLDSPLKDSFSDCASEGRALCDNANTQTCDSRSPGPSNLKPQTGVPAPPTLASPLCT